jgi:hypothetical protein
VQAPYLLAQMHARNLDMKSKGSSDLDPNEINAAHFDTLRTLLEVVVANSDANLANKKQLFDGEAIYKQG